MPYIQLKDLELYYEEYGKGETVLFLHSHFSRGVIAFEGQIKAFSAHYRCLFPDFRGHGKTKCKSLEWNSRMLADDMVNLIDALKLESVHLVGYSCGASVGCYLAAKYPEKVKSLTTIGGGSYPRPDGSTAYLPENVNAQFAEEMNLRHFVAHNGDWKTYLRMTVADWQSHPSLTDKEWKSIKCPAFFINGENDPFGTCAELLQRVPHANSFEVKDAGHRPHFPNEQADEVNEMIFEFFDNIKTNIIGCCGHDCSRCITYLATIKNDDTLRKQSQLFYKTIFGLDIPLDEVNCLGCHSNNVFKLCKNCPFTKCASERKIAECSECVEYPCAALAEYQEKYVNKCNQVTCDRGDRVNE